MRIVDSHVHLYPAETNAHPAAWAEARGERHWALLCTRSRRNGHPVQGFPGLDDLLRAMDQAGVERAVLQGWYWENHDTCVQQNRFYGACVRAHPDRLSGFATFHPGAGEIAVRDELRRSKQDGLSGLGELSPDSQRYSLDHPGWVAAVEFAAKAGWPICLHVTDPAGAAFPGKTETPLGPLVQLAAAHPSTNFILAHWGGRLPLTASHGTQSVALGNLFFDTAASPLLYKDAGVAAAMIAAVGARRILFGSDFPLVLYPSSEVVPTMRTFVDEFRNSGLPADVLDILFAQTALTLLRLE